MKIRRLMWLAVIALVAMLVVTSCGGDEEAPTAQPTQPSATRTAPPQATPTPVPTATTAPTPTPSPKRGGTLRLNYGGFMAPPGLDHHRYPNTLEYAFIPLNGLLRSNPYKHEEIIGDLAQRWQVSAAGDEYTFNLRDGVKWTDGKQFTSADVLFNIQKVGSDSQGYVSYLKSFLAGVSKAEAIDPLTVKVTLKAPSVSLISALAMVPMKLYPAHLPFPDFEKNPIGTGPFKIVSYAEPGKQVDMIRNTTYFGAGTDNLPYLDRINLIVISDLALREAAYRTGQVDVSGRVQSIALASKDAVVRAVPGTRDFTYIVSFNFLAFKQNAFFGDPRVREAIDLMLDREELAAVGMKGEAAVGGLNVPASLNGSWALPTAQLQQQPGYRKPKDQDYARARQLIQEIGVEKFAQPISLKAYVGREQEISTVVAQQLSKFGIKVNLQVIQFPVLITDLSGGNFDMAVPGAGIYVDDPSSTSGTVYTSTGSRNYPKWSVPEIDRLFAEQDRTTDPVKRKQLAQDYEKAAINAHVTPLLVWTTSTQFVRPELKNITQPGAALAYSNVYDFSRVWLDK